MKHKHTLENIKKNLILAGVVGSSLLSAGIAKADESSTSPSDVVIESSAPSSSTSPSDVVIDEPTTPTTAPDDVVITAPSTDTPSSTTVPSSSSDTSSSSETTTETGTSTETSDGDKTSSSTDTATETDDSISTPDEKGNVTIPTTDGGTTTVTTDKSIPTNNPNVTADTAQKAGVSQVGTTSTVTGQIVRDVTSTAPVTLASGYTVTDIQSGVATLTNGTKVDLTSLGATKNSDGTYSVTTASGEKATLPETGEKTTLLGFFGLLSMVLSYTISMYHKAKTMIRK